MTKVQTTNRIAKLQAELAGAQMREKALNAELAKVQRKVDRVEGRVRDLQEEIARCQIESWGSQPDWAYMLKGSTMATFYALEAHLARIGLLMSQSWSDVKERVVAISINSGEIGAVERNAAAVRMLLPHMKPHVGGSVWFKINSFAQTECMWTLRVNAKKSKYELVQEVCAQVKARLPFPTLEAALTHVQQHIWAEDILDAQPIALLENT